MTEVPTMYVDASYFKYEKTGAWAAVILSKEKKHVKTDMCPFLCSNITECELFAAGAGLVIMLDLFKGCKTFKIISDSSAVCDFLKQGSAEHIFNNKGVEYFVNRFKEFAYETNNLNITFEHSHGHKDDELINYCDKMAVITNKSFNSKKYNRYGTKRKED